MKGRWIGPFGVGGGLFFLGFSIGIEDGVRVAIAAVMIGAGVLHMWVARRLAEIEAELAETDR